MTAPRLASIRIAGLALAMFLSPPCFAQLTDNFTNDVSLNTAVWTNSGAFLTNLAATYNSTFVPPILSFSGSGMNFSGATNNHQLSGIQSLAQFQPPFTVTTSVTGLQAHGDAFEVFLFSADQSQWITLSGNLNPGNGNYFGVWANYENSGFPFLNLGNSLYTAPIFGEQYTLRLFIDGMGTAAVTLLSSNGTTLGVQTNLAVGNGPFYLILGEREGTPNTAGPNVGQWNDVSLASGLPAAISLSRLNNGFAQLNFAGAPGFTNVVQAATNLTPPITWSFLRTNTADTNGAFSFIDTNAPNYPTRFYRTATQ